MAGVEVGRGRVRGAFLALLGFVVIGLGGSLYYGDLDFGSLTKSSSTMPVGSTWAFLPIGIGVALVVVGIVVLVYDRRSRLT